jgi:hypothetical protein
MPHRGHLRCGELARDAGDVAPFFANFARPVLVSSRVREKRLSDFSWLHANIHYLAGNGRAEIRVLGFRA